MKTKLYISFRTASLYKSRITDCCFYSVAEDNSAICYQLKHTGFSTKQVEDFNEVLEDDKNQSNLYPSRQNRLCITSYS